MKTSLLVTLVALVSTLTLACQDLGVSPEEICAHGEKLAREEAAAERNGHPEKAEQLREAARRECVGNHTATQKRVEPKRWRDYGRCMVGKKTRAEQRACEEHVR